MVYSIASIQAPKMESKIQKNELIALYNFKE